MQFGMLLVKTISLSAFQQAVYELQFIDFKVTGLTQVLMANDITHVWSLMQLTDQFPTAQYREQPGEAGRWSIKEKNSHLLATLEQLFALRDKPQ